MADDISVKLQERSVLGKGLGNIRQEGLVPAVIHNHGQESVHVMAPETELVKVFRAAGKHHPVDLRIGDKKYLALIRDAHFHPVKRRLQHVVFQAIRQNETVEAEIPVRVEGDIPAEKVGLMVLHQLDTVQVEALPRDLPDELFVDGEKLAELHDKLTVGDIKAPKGVTILTDPEHPIATVVETKAMMSDEAAEESEGEAVGGEGETGNTPDNADAEAAGQQS